MSSRRAVDSFGLIASTRVETCLYLQARSSLALSLSRAYGEVSALADPVAPIRLCRCDRSSCRDFTPCPVVFLARTREVFRIEQERPVGTRTVLRARHNDATPRNGVRNV